MSGLKIMCSTAKDKVLAAVSDPAMNRSCSRRGRGANVIIFIIIL
jgi:hypothetical protein